jgi:hypothetical protein
LSAAIERLKQTPEIEEPTAGEITLDELRELEATVGWTEDDDEAIAMAASTRASSW